MRLDYKVSFIVAIPLMVGVLSGYLFLIEITYPHINRLEGDFLVGSGSKTRGILDRQYDKMTAIIQSSMQDTEALSRFGIENFKADGSFPMTSHGMSMDCREGQYLVAHNEHGAVRKKISNFLHKEMQARCYEEGKIPQYLRVTYDQLTDIELAIVLPSKDSVNEYLRIYEIRSGKDALLQITYPGRIKIGLGDVFVRGAWFLAVCVGVACCFVVWVVHRHVSGPLYRLGKDMVDKSDSSRQITISDYLSDLAPVIEAYNTTQETILGRKAELQERVKALDETVRERTATLHRMNIKLIESREDERARIARELHDGAIGELKGVTYMLESLGMSLTGKERDLAKKAEMHLDLVYASLRSLYEGVRPLVAAIEELGLAKTIEFYVSEFIETTGIEVDLVLELGNVMLSPDVSIAAFRVVQEGLTNIVKHSRADQVKVTVRYMETTEYLHVIVEDDGTGFNSGQLQRAASGISNIRERASLLGGTSKIQSGPEGTVILWAVPRFRPKA